MDFLSGRPFVRTALDVLSGRRFVRTALDILSGRTCLRRFVRRHFVRTALDVLSGPSYGWSQVVMGGIFYDVYDICVIYNDIYIKYMIH